MLITCVKLSLSDHSAAEVQQGMVCGLTLSISGFDQEMHGGHQDNVVRQLELKAASFEILDEATLSVKVEMLVQVDE